MLQQHHGLHFFLEDHNPESLKCLKLLKQQSRALQDLQSRIALPSPVDLLQGDWQPVGVFCGPVQKLDDPPYRQLSIAVEGFWAQIIIRILEAELN